MGFGPILNAGAVADLSTDCGDTVLCDVRWYLDGRSGLEAYEAGHLPGAVFVDLDEGRQEDILLNFLNCKKIFFYL